MMNEKAAISLIFVTTLILSSGLLTNSSLGLIEEVEDISVIKQTTISKVEDNYFAVIITAGNQKQDEKDSSELANILTNSGWNEQNILQIVEEEATKKNILTKPLEWLNEKSINEEDVVLFYFSMHGDQTDDITPIDEPDGLDEYLVPFDYNTTNNNILLDDELHAVFSQLTAPTLVIIFEACHSGGMIDGTHDLSDDKRVIIMSASSEETSGSFRLFRRWLFPYYLLKGLNGPADSNNDNIITAEEAYSFAKIPTTIHSITLWIQLFIHPFVKPHLQHPQLFDGYPTANENSEEISLIYLQ